MKTRITIFLAMIVSLVSCQKEAGLPTSQTRYSDLKIEKFEYGAVGSAGGTLSPTLAYSYTESVIWSDGREESKTLSSGAESAFVIQDVEGFTVADDGVIKVAVLDGTEDISCTVSVTVSVGGIKTQASCVVRQSADCTVAYSELEITELSYPVVPAEGGTVSPQIRCSYKKVTTYGSGEKKEEFSSEGVTLVFSSKDEIKVDSQTGEITMDLNGYETNEYNVTVTATLGDMSVSRDVVVTRLGQEDRVVGSTTEQLPLKLAPHTCVHYLYQRMEQQDWNIPVKEETEYISNSTDGTHQKDWQGELLVNDNHCFNDMWAKGYPEYVSAKGTSIRVSGGELVRIDLYKSGKRDTVVVAEPIFNTDVQYTFKRNDKRFSGGFVEEKTQSPSSYFNDGVWDIKRIGAEEVSDIIHTLTAVAGENSTFVKLRQNNNFVVGETDGRVEFYRDSVLT